MTAHRGYYSLVQYCPNPSRLESANVGVVLYSPEITFLDVMMSKGADRPRRFFGIHGQQRQRLENSTRSLSNRLRQEKKSFRTLEDFEQFIQTRANDLILTDPRPIRVEDPSNQLSELFNELVGSRSASPRQPKRVAELENFFRRSDLQSRIEFNTEITIPLIERTITVPYAYLNGKVHLIKPESFSATSHSALEKAERVAIEGHLIAKNELRDGLKGCLTVVASYHSDSEEPEVKNRVRALLKEYQVRVFDIAEMDQLFTKVSEDLSYK